MKINLSTTSNLTMNGKIPLSEYKGPILKLTPKEKKQVDALQKNITDYNIEIIKLKSILYGLPYCERMERISGQINHLLHLIEVASYNIELIKKNRIAIQRERINAKKDKKS